MAARGSPRSPRISPASRVVRRSKRPRGGVPHLSFGAARGHADTSAAHGRALAARAAVATLASREGARRVTLDANTAAAAAAAAAATAAATAAAAASAERSARALLHSEGRAAVLKDERLLRSALATIEAPELSRVVSRAMRVMLAAVADALLKLNWALVNVALASLIGALEPRLSDGTLDMRMTRRLLELLIQRADRRAADQAVNWISEWFERRHATYCELLLQSMASTPSGRANTNAWREARVSTVCRLSRRLHSAMMGCRMPAPARWPTISYEQWVLMVKGDLAIQLKHPETWESLVGTPSATVATPPPPSQPCAPPRDAPDPDWMPCAAKAERLEGVFAYHEMQRIKATGRGSDVTHLTRRAWALEFGVTGGDRIVKECLKRWKGDVARHRSNATCLDPALAALRASEHAARFSKAQFGAIVAPVAKSALATERLFVFLREKGYVVNTSGGGGLRFRVVPAC